MKKLIVLADAGTAYVPLRTTVVPWLTVQLTLASVSPPRIVSSVPTVPKAPCPGPAPPPLPCDPPLHAASDAPDAASARPRIIAVPMTDFFTMTSQKFILDWCASNRATVSRRVRPRSDDAQRLFKTRAIAGERSRVSRLLRFD
jgi:hypothetical protein